MWSAECLLFRRQTGSRHTILEVCEFRFGSFPIALAIFSTNRNKNLKLNCIDFFRVSTKLEIEIDFRDVQNSTLAVSRLHLIDPSSIDHRHCSATVLVI